MSEKKWKLFEGGGCPNCGGDLEVFSECPASGDEDERVNVYDGEEVRCNECKFTSCISVNEDGSAFVQDGNPNKRDEEVEALREVIKSYTKEAEALSRQVNEYKSEVARLKGLIERAHTRGWNDGIENKIAWSDTSWKKFKLENNIQ